MKVAPVFVPLDPYRGSQQARLRKAIQYNECARAMEAYLNASIEADPTPIQTYYYPQLARATGFDRALVRRVLFAVDNGHNGLTVARSEAAWQEFFKTG